MNNDGSNQNYRVFNSIPCKLTKICVALSIFLTASWAFAESKHEVKALFDKNENPLPEYMDILDQAAPQELVLEFSDGKRFQVSGPQILGQGGSTRIFKLQNGNALRVPLIEKKSRAWTENFRLLSDYLKSHQVFLRHQVPVPQLFQFHTPSKPTKPAQYVEVEAIVVEDMLDDWFKRQTAMPNESDLKWRELLSFARRLSAFSTILDFWPHQVAWNGKQWVLLDWMGHYYLTKPWGPSPFYDWLNRTSITSISPIARDLVIRLDMEVRNNRTDFSMCESYFLPGMNQLRQFEFHSNSLKHKK